MAFAAERVEVNNVTPTIVTPEGREPGTTLTLAIQNLSGDAIYVGTADMTDTEYGASIVPGAMLTIDNLPPKDEVYVLSVESTAYVGVLKVHR